MRRFWVTASLGFALVIALIAVPSAFAIGYAFVAAERRDHVTAELTLDVVHAERLRTEAERASSAARAYLVSGDPAFIPEMERARAGFREQLRLLRDRTRPAGAAVIRRVEVEARAYNETVDGVLAMRAGKEGAARADLARRFEEEMIPRHRALGDALDALDAFREEQVAEVGRQADRVFVGGLTVAARDDVLGVVAHDLRTPLTAIGMKAAMIRRGEDPRSRSPSRGPAPLPSGRLGPATSVPGRPARKLTPPVRWPRAPASCLRSRLGSGKDTHAPLRRPRFPQLPQGPGRRPRALGRGRARAGRLRER
jgi:signal transduction histidine kinase